MKGSLLLLMISIVILAHNDCRQAMKHYYKDKKVLVTGGCGFIGSHLVARLVSYRAQVTVLDDLSTGSYDRIASYADQITFVKGSIVDDAMCVQAVAGKTHVFHLAAAISVPQSVVDPIFCYKINVDGTCAMLEASRHAGIERFVFSSSAAVYGVAEGICSESQLCMPTSPYGYSKLIGEQLCMQYAHVYGLQTMMLRYFNVYGAGQNPRGAYAAVVARFKDSMEHNEPITIFGDGLQTRDFIDVAQVVDANLIAGMIPAEQINERIINVATGKSITLLALLEQLKGEYPLYNEAINFMPARGGDIKYSSADCSRLVRLFSFISS